MRQIWGIALAAVLAGCGGGGDVAGDTDDFVISPEGTTYTPPEALCTAGVVLDAAPVQYVINGGTPPFRLVADNPSVLTLSATELTGKDPVFTVKYTGSACAGTYVVTILDYHSRLITLPIEVEPETDTAPPQ